MDKLLPAGVKDPVLVWIMCGRIEHPAVIIDHVDEHHVRVSWHSNGERSIVNLANVRYDAGGRGRKRRQLTAVAAAATAGYNDNNKDDSAQKREALLKSRKELRRARKRRKQVLQSKQHVKRQSAAADSTPLIAQLPDTGKKVIVTVVAPSLFQQKSFTSIDYSNEPSPESLLKTQQQEKRKPQQGYYYYPGDSSDDDDALLPLRRKEVAILPRKKKYILCDDEDDDDEYNDSSDDELSNNIANKRETAVHRGTSMDRGRPNGNDDKQKKEKKQPFVNAPSNNKGANVSETRSDRNSFPSKSEPQPSRETYPAVGSLRVVQSHHQEMLHDSKRKAPKEHYYRSDDDSSDDEIPFQRTFSPRRKSYIHDSSDDEAVAFDGATGVEDTLSESSVDEKTLPDTNASNNGEASITGGHSDHDNGNASSRSKSQSKGPREGYSSARLQVSYRETGEQDSKHKAQKRNCPADDSSEEDDEPHAGGIQAFRRPDAQTSNGDASVFGKDTEDETSYYEGIGEVSVFEKETEDDGSSEPGIRDEQTGMQPQDASVQLENQSEHRAYGRLPNDPRAIREGGSIDSASATSDITRKTAEWKASEGKKASDEIDRLLHKSNKEYFMYRNFPFIDTPEPLDPKNTLCATKEQLGSVELLNLFKMKMCGKCGKRLGIYFHMFCSERKLMGTSCSICHFDIEQPFNAPFRFSQPAWTATQAEKALALPGLKDYLMSNCRDNALELPNGTLVFKDEIVTQCAVEICGSVWDFHRAMVMYLKRQVDAVPKRSAQQSIKPASKQLTDQSIEPASEGSVQKSVKADAKGSPQQSTKPRLKPSVQQSIEPPPKLSAQLSITSAAEGSVQKSINAATKSSVHQSIESAPKGPMQKSIKPPSRGSVLQNIKPALRESEQHKSRSKPSPKLPVSALNLSDDSVRNSVNGMASSKTMTLIRRCSNDSNADI